jgi:hypothetical protein
MRYFFLVLFVTVVLGCFVPGCGSDSKPSNESSNNNTENVSPPSANPNNSPSILSAKKKMPGKLPPPPNQ